MKKAIVTLCILLTAVVLFSQVALEKIAVVPVPPPAGFQVSVSINKGQGATYHPGENIMISFSTNKDAYVVLYDIMPSGEVRIIFPNAYDKDNFVKANRVYTVPRQGYLFLIDNVPGREYLQIIACLSQFSTYETWHRMIITEAFPMASMNAEDYFMNYEQKIIVVPDNPKPVWTSATTWFNVN